MRCVPGGVNSNVSDFPDFQSIVWTGRRFSPVTLSWPGKIRGPTK